MKIQQVFDYWRSERNYFKFWQETVGVLKISFALIYQYKMTQYNTLNIKLLNSQFNKLKSWLKNGTKVASNLSSNVTGNFNDETDFTHKLLLTNTQVSRFCKAFANYSWGNMKLSKSQLSKIE